MTRTIGPSLEKTSRATVKQGRPKTTGRRPDYALLQRRVQDPIARELEGDRGRAGSTGRRLRRPRPVGELGAAVRHFGEVPPLGSQTLRGAEGRQHPASPTLFEMKRPARESFVGRSRLVAEGEDPVGCCRLLRRGGSRGERALAGSPSRRGIKHGGGPSWRSSARSRDMWPPVSWWPIRARRPSPGEADACLRGMGAGSSQVPRRRDARACAPPDPWSQPRTRTAPGR